MQRIKRMYKSGNHEQDSDVQKWNIRSNRSNDVYICVVLSYMFGGNLYLIIILFSLLFSYFNYVHMQTLIDYMYNIVIVD